MQRAVSSRPAPRKVTCGGITSFSLTTKRPRGNQHDGPRRARPLPSAPTGSHRCRPAHRPPSSRNQPHLSAVVFPLLGAEPQCRAVRSRRAVRRTHCAQTTHSGPEASSSGTVTASEKGSAFSNCSSVTLPSSDRRSHGRPFLLLTLGSVQGCAACRQHRPAPSSMAPFAQKGYW